MVRSTISYPASRLGSSLKVTQWVAAGVLGAALGALALRAQDWTLYQAVLAGFAVILLIVMAVVGNVRRVLLGAMALVVPMSVLFSPLAKSLPYHPGGAYAILTFYPYDFPLLGLLAIWVADNLVERRRSRLSAIDVSMLLLILWSVLTIFNSADVAFSGFEVLRMLKLYLLSVVVAANVRGKTDLKIVLGSLFVGLCLEAAFSVVQYITGNNYGFAPSAASLGRVAGTIGWPNTFGAYAGALVAVAMILWVLGPARQFRALPIIAGIAGSIPLILTLSRGAWLGLLLALAVGLLVAAYRGRFGNEAGVRVSLVLLLFGLVGLFFADEITARVAATSLTSSQIVDRLRLNDVAFNMILANPILGVGINNFAAVMHQDDPSGVTYAFPEPVHNVYLLFAAETGLVGFSLFLWLVVSVLRTAIMAASVRDPFLSASALALLAGILVLLISNLTDVHLRTDTLYGLFWLLVGLVVAIKKIADGRVQEGIR